MPYTMKKLIALSLSAILSSTTIMAERTNFTLSERTKPFTPEEQQKMFHVPEGFIVELVASEANGLVNPIDIAFDDAGRMWTQTAKMYPLDPVSSMSWGNLLKFLEDDPKAVEEKFPEYKKIKDYYQLKTKGEDQILIIEDPTKKVEGQIPSFVDGLAIPQSILPYKNGVYVAHGSEMLYFQDTDGDGKADKHETVLTGFGFNDTHTMSHLLVRGPGGWVHFSHGALNAGKVTAVKSGESKLISYSKIARFSLDGNHLEVLNNGINNIWGFQLKANGQWYGSEANDMSFSLIPFHPMMGYSGIGNDKLRPYQPFAAPVHKFRVSGTGLSGLAFEENGIRGFPKEWKNYGFLANPITSKINAVICDRNPDGSVISEHGPDFLTCDDDWFRPVNIEFGPDGCMYIVDWYNKVVSHNEVSRDHPDRDKSHGRIWRVRHESQTPQAVPNIAKLPNSELLKHLNAQILWEQRAAWQQIVDRNAQELIPQLKALAANNVQQHTSRIHSLWCLEGLKHYDHDLMVTLSKDQHADIRREAVRALSSFNPPLEQTLQIVTPLSNDPHYMVKEQVLRTLAEINKANQESIELLVKACVPASKSNAFGQGYEANFQRFLARKAFEQYPQELSKFLESDRAKNLPEHSLKWASEAVGTTLKKDLFVKNWKGQKLDKETLISITPLLEFKDLFDLIKPQLATPEFLNLALEVQPEVSTKLLHKAIIPGVKNLVDDPEHRELAVKVTNKFRSDAIDHQLPRYGYEMPIKDISIGMIDAIGINVGAGQGVLKRIINTPETSMAQKARCLIHLYPRFKEEMIESAEKLINTSSESEKSALVSGLVQFTHGSHLYLDLLERNLVEMDELSADIAERTASFKMNHPASPRLLEYAKAQKAKNAVKLDEKLKTYTTATENLTGNPETGKAMFSSCLSCHQAGGEGYNIAPALDGSANRDIHHLLTAIVKPNEAVEGGYRIYRVIKATGEILEGYMYSNNKNGVTLAYMGGAKTFIPREVIASQTHINKSFMPDTFGNFPEQTMVDLVAYIKTLK